MNRLKRQEIFSRWQERNAKPTSELVYSSPFELLVAVVLSAQATDVSVNKATRGLFERANTPGQILQLGEVELKQYIRQIGLYNTKARNILKTCQLLEDNHSGQVPKDRTALEALPGVGRKTANVILNTAFGVATIAVDTHVFRVANRTGIAPGKTVVEVEKRLLRLVPEEFLQDAHHWLILHGRYTCMARTPKCSDCLVQDLCEYTRKVG